MQENHKFLERIFSEIIFGLGKTRPSEQWRMRLEKKKRRRKRSGPAVVRSELFGRWFFLFLCVFLLPFLFWFLFFFPSAAPPLWLLFPFLLSLYPFLLFSLFCSSPSVVLSLSLSFVLSLYFVLLF